MLLFLTTSLNEGESLDTIKVSGDYNNDADNTDDDIHDEVDDDITKLSDVALKCCEISNIRNE